MLGLFNVSKDLEIRLGQVLQTHNFNTDILPEIQGLFIDWLPNTHEMFGKQAMIVETYIKSGIPTIIYDRFMTLSKKEFLWLQKFNVSFFEPAIHYRRGFEFFPQWTEPLENDWDEHLNKNIHTHLGYSGKITDKIAAFEKYFMNYAGMFPESVVAYWPEYSEKDKLKKDKKSEWDNYNLTLVDSLDYSDTAFTILIGAKTDYLTGYLRNDLFSIMKKGCVPMLPIEHRFYGAMFKELVISDERFIDYFIANSIKIRNVIIEEIFTNIFTHYPEFTIDYAVDKIKYYLE